MSEKYSCFLQHFISILFCSRYSGIVDVGNKCNINYKLGPGVCN